MQFLEGLRLSSELLLEPLDGRSLIGNKELELQHLLYRHALPVVLRYLDRKEVHPVALREALGKAGVKLRRGKRYHHAPLDVKGHHPVIQQVILSLGNDFGLTVLRDKHRELPQVGTNEIPNPFLGTRDQFEALLEPSVRLVT